ncbi:MAG: AEC family transporter [Firmicutes bacterium]|nr:AEC family transporter [Bacillota bacterium]
MIQNFMTVFGQVMVLFLLMGLGVILNKTGRLNREICKALSDIVVVFVAPCVIIKSFIRDYNLNMLKNLLIAILLSCVLHILMIVISKMAFREDEGKKRRVLTFASVFSNAGFISIPLQEAILGTDGVFYGAAYLAIFNIFLWSFGIVEMSGDKSLITPKKLLVSPGIIGILIGVILFAFSIKPPMVITSVIGHISALNLPIPMFIVGYYIAETDIFRAIKNSKLYLCLFLRLILYPIAALLLFKLLNIDNMLAVSLILSVCAPVGATATMFSEKFDGDTALSVELVSISTLFSLITMPIITAFCQTIF